MKKLFAAAIVLCSIIDASALVTFPKAANNFQLYPDTALAEVKGTITENSITFSDKGVVTDLTYTAANGVECVYDNDESNGEYYKVTP